MKIAFVTKVKEKDLKTLFPWAKKIIPAYGGYLACSVDKVSTLQKEFADMFKREMERAVKREKEMKRFMGKPRRQDPRRMVIHG